MSRRPIVAANWKLHGGGADGTRLALDVVAALGAEPEAEVVVCPPFTALTSVAGALAGSAVALGAQHCHWEDKGAFTGEIAPAMLAEAGCRYVIVGHSERRTLFGETDAMVQRKAAAVLRAGLTPIVCIGETLEEREAGRTESVLDRQLETGLAGLEASLEALVIAYEPVWAIGTGRTASDETAQHAHAHVRRRLASLGGEAAAGRVRIQYGGSVKPANASGLFAQPDIDGGLIGGASLDAGSFAAIVAALA